MSDPIYKEKSSTHVVFAALFSFGRWVDFEVGALMSRARRQRRRQRAATGELTIFGDADLRLRGPLLSCPHATSSARHRPNTDLLAC